MIREQSAGKKSLNDFARAFFGVNDRDYGELTYTFDDVVATLNKVQPYDWANYLTPPAARPHPACAARRHHPGRLQAGLHRSADQIFQGWREEAARSRISAIRAASPSATRTARYRHRDLGQPRVQRRAGEIGTQVVALNGRAFDSDGLKDAIKAAKGARASRCTCWSKSGDHLSDGRSQLARGASKYPRLEKNGRGPGHARRPARPLALTAGANMGRSMTIARRLFGLAAFALASGLLRLGPLHREHSPRLRQSSSINSAICPIGPRSRCFASRCSRASTPERPTRQGRKSK